MKAFKGAIFRICGLSRDSSASDAELLVMTSFPDELRLARP